MNLQEDLSASCRGLDFLSFLSTSGRLDHAAVARVTHAMTAASHPADTVLLELGLLPEQELAAAQAQYLGVGLVEPEEFPEVAVAEGMLPKSFLRSSAFIPLALEANRIVVAAARPLDHQSTEALGFFLDRKVELRVARRDEWEKAYERLYENSASSEFHSRIEAAGGSEEADVERLKDIAREAPVIRFASKLISEAVQRGASDIHIEPLIDKLQIRMRIDGVLGPAQTVDKSLQAGVISRIKIMARLNIAERRLPQDGRVSLAVRGREIDFRVSTVPTIHGESVVLRVLDRNEAHLDVHSLGFDEEAANLLSQLIAQPNGIVLVSGPTGSGKTTTLYAALQKMRGKERKILTIEDPVEYHLGGVMQTPVKPQIGLDFAAGLRAFLRHDPDVIMVGEIRDSETARIAVQAALTGHLVLSTIHTNSAAACVSRLLDMGVDAYLLASTLRAAVAQRLVRKLCQECCVPRAHSASQLMRWGIRVGDQVRLSEAKGCAACSGTGYRGRTTIYEIMQVTQALQQLILQDPAMAKIEQVARHNGMRSLFETGIAKAMAGETSMEEVLRVTSAD